MHIICWLLPGLYRQRERERERERDRQTDRQTDRETERDRDRDREMLYQVDTSWHGEQYYISVVPFKVRKRAKFRKPYNQVPHKYNFDDKLFWYILSYDQVQ